MTNFLINWVLTYSKRFIFFILLLTVAAGCFIYKNISVNTSNTDLLSKELTFRKNDIAFKKEFPQFSNNIDQDLIAVIYKGRDNYICRTRLANLLQNYKILLQPFEYEKLLPILVWEWETKSGDINECNGFQVTIN